MINEVVIVGRVGKDPYFHAFDNGGAVAQFSVATTERGYKLQNGTEVPEMTDWHTVVVRNKTAEVARDFVKKGMLVGISGSLHYRKYESGDRTCYATEIHADRMQMLSSKKDSEAQQPRPQPAEESSNAPSPDGGYDLPF